MVIAINTTAVGKESAHADNFIFEVFSRIIPANPHHTFIVISEKKISFNPNGNVTHVIIEPKKNIVQRFVWYNIKINKILKKYKADIFISYGAEYSAIKVPQCLIVPDIAFTHFPQLFTKSLLFFYKLFTPSFLKKSKKIITFSKSCKEDISKQFKISLDKISVVYKGVSEKCREISFDERENIKAKYANGNEYFVYTGEIGSDKNLLNLFKAFSAFKKRQKSNMQLIIAGNAGWKYKDVIESLRLFKFKNEVKILNDISFDEVIKIVSAAYVFIYPSRYEAFPDEALQAMKSGVPVIASSLDVMHEIFADAALYADPENFKEIAIKMMTLFRDENARKILIEKGNKQAEKFSWDITANLLWKTILNPNG